MTPFPQWSNKSISIESAKLFKNMPQHFTETPYSPIFLFSPSSWKNRTPSVICFPDKESISQLPLPLQLDMGVSLSSGQWGVNRGNIHDFQVMHLKQGAWPSSLPFPFPNGWDAHMMVGTGAATLSWELKLCCEWQSKRKKQPVPLTPPSFPLTLRLLIFKLLHEIETSILSKLLSFENASVTLAQSVFKPILTPGYIRRES